MRTINMTIGEDIEANFLIRIVYEGGGIIHGAQRSILLSGNTYDGQIFQTESWSAISKTINVSAGGGLGDLETVAVFLMRDNQDTATKDYFNSWFPVIGKPGITSYTAEIGLVWDGASQESDITWLKSFYIENYDVSFDLITLTLIELDELQNKLIPQYKIQDSTVNGISYYPKAEDNIGKTIPIIYGWSAEVWSFPNIVDGITNGYVPAFSVDKMVNKYVFSSHGVSFTPDFLLRYLSGPDLFMDIQTSIGGGLAISGNLKGSHVQMSSPPYGKLIGQIIIPMREQAEGDVTNPLNIPVTEIEKVTDFDVSNFALYNVDLTTFSAYKVGSPINDELIGILTQANTDATINMFYKIVGPANSTLSISLWNNTISPSTFAVAVGFFSGPAQTAQMVGNMGLFAPDLSIPGGLQGRIKDISDFLTLEYQVIYTKIAPDVNQWCEVTAVWIDVQNINVLGMKTRIKKVFKARRHLNRDQFEQVRED
jgi:hypothetical protein